MSQAAVTAHRDSQAAAGCEQAFATEVAAAALRAARRVAPLWPLANFVAVNPFMGVSDQRFTDAAATLARAAGARMTMPRSFYAEAVAAGRIEDRDLAEAARASGSGGGSPASVAALKRQLTACPGDATGALLPTVADVAARLTGRDWPRLVVERISAWAATHFDDGQAAWRSPWRDLPAYAAWRAQACLDRTPEVLGLSGFRAAVRTLPEDAAGMTRLAVAELGIPRAGQERYFHRLLATVGGWAARARHRGWQAELQGSSDATLTELLAVRLAWELALWRSLGDAELADAWTAARSALAAPAPPDPGMETDLVLQSAYERAWQRRLAAKIGRRPDPCDGPAGRAAAQAVFCIDVRSEVFRRALESVAPGLETLGFAGFFGLPIEYVRIGDEHGSAQCPVLLAPQATVREGLATACGGAEDRLVTTRRLRRRAMKAWKSFKLAAVSSFAYVETLGLLFAVRLVTDTLGWTRPVVPPAAAGLDGRARRSLGPRLDPRSHAGRATGLTHDQRVAFAESALRGMSLTRGFARLVLLAGHGSTTVNNPHATGLDCGACGGHTGEANARVAAAVLNDPGVREALAARGIGIPADTVFVAALHDTTTDRVTLFDEAALPASHAADLAQLKQWLAEAGGTARKARSASLGVAGPDVDGAVEARSRDWSQVRPEWGLAGCAAFIAAPRARTAGVDLGGRAFLHSYDWRSDRDFAVLELIMTAPVVVASWISLQYYGSTVDNRCFGSGNKVLHNVVGTMGVLEGNGGDLRTGLPWQSVHDGERLVHEPLRLSVLIEAPVEAINRVVTKHESVRRLLDNHWLHLFQIGEGGRVRRRYAGGLRWEEVRDLDGDEPLATGLAA